MPKETKEERKSRYIGRLIYFNEFGEKTGKDKSVQGWYVDDNQEKTVGLCVLLPNDEKGNCINLLIPLEKIAAILKANKINLNHAK